MELKDQFLADAREYLSALPIGTEITVDDVRPHVPLPEGVDGRVMGSIFKKVPGWVRVGRKLSDREACHKSNPLVVRRKVAA